MDGACVGTVLSPELISGIIGGALTTLAPAAAYITGKLTRQRTTDQALIHGMRALLAIRIDEDHRKYAVNQGWISPQAKAHTIVAGKAYTDLGGNGAGEVQLEELLKLPTKGE